MSLLKIFNNLYTKGFAGKIQIFAFHIFTKIYYAVFCLKSLEFNLDIATLFNCYIKKYLSKRAFLEHFQASIIGRFCEQVPS